MRTQYDIEPPENLKRIFSEKILRTEQVVVLFEKLATSQNDHLNLEKEEMKNPKVPERLHLFIKSKLAKIPIFNLMLRENPLKS